MVIGTILKGDRFTQSMKLRDHLRILPTTDRKKNFINSFINVESLLFLVLGHNSTQGD